MKKYWSSLDEYENKEVRHTDETSELGDKNEILAFLSQEESGKQSSRRDFLKFCGFSFATAALVSSCKNPVNKAIPYLFKPEDITPGKWTYYASTFYNGRDYGSVLVKVRDGRPIKIEGNTLSSINGGGTTARIQASVLGAYDDAGRVKKPSKEGKEIIWDTADYDIKTALGSIAAAGGKTVLLSSSIISPSTQALISEFGQKYPGFSHVVYDSISFSAMLEANKMNFGQEVIPSYSFDKASVIVSFNADFLGTWVSPAEFSAQYARMKDVSKLGNKINKHFQFESNLSLTGSNADKRIPVKPSEEGLYILHLYNEIAAKAGKSVQSAGEPAKEIKEVAEALWNSKGTSLVICGSNNVNHQVMVNAINVMLGNYNNTLDIHQPYHLYQGIDRNVTELIGEMGKGNVAALLVYNVNPVYDHPMAKDFEAGLKKVKLSISFAGSLDETSALCTYNLPEHHYLEAWNDAMPKEGVYSLAQPTLNPLFDTRSFQDNLLKWTGSKLDYHAYIQAWWKANLFPKQSKTVLFQQFWDTMLQAGVFEIYERGKNILLETSDFATIAITLDNIQKQASRNSASASGMELIAYESVGIGNGSMGNNPWLQELPDPVSKTTWDNYAAISPKTAASQGLADGDVIKAGELELPVLIQPGIADNVMAVALGYGRTKAGKVGDGVGVRIIPLLQIVDGNYSYTAQGITIGKTAKKYDFARTQIHHTMEGRPIVRETTLPEYVKDPAAGNEMHAEIEAHHYSLYPDNEFKGHWWALGIDLNKCTGCSACVIACQAENNIPVIGKQEVMLKRIMHWIRLDRYYSDDAENPGVVFQPIMCQHCDHAPCENVCPVAATTHSSEGLNQMAYNRCIGTKYCINNCPYKVRRFNWYRYADNKVFSYGTETDLGKMVLNPDVTVRERGVVEKCTFCAQRIQETKLHAKLEGRELADGEMMTACMQSCPSKALTFGDRNNPNSEVSKMFKDPRNYHILEELHTLPSVGYLTKVRNQE